MADDATNIYDLDPALPTASASAGEGDDEIRIFKQAVKNSIAGNAGNVDWSTKTWDRSQPDRYDTAALEVGPRSLNTVPRVIDDLVASANTQQGQIDFLTAQVQAFTLATQTSGMISIWSGAANAIPANYYLCDGTQGTPNLAGLFVRGVGGLVTVGLAGGASNVVSGADGAHTHTGGSHALTIAELPAHGHPYQAYAGAALTVQSTVSGGAVMNDSGNTVYPGHTGAPSNSAGQMIGGTGSGTAHSHSLDASATHTHTVDTMPPWYALCYVMYKPPAAPTLTTPVPDQANTVGNPPTLDVSGNFAGETAYSAYPLPPGVTINTATGVFGGTCSVVGVTTVTLTAYNSGGNVVDTFLWTVT